MLARAKPAMAGLTVPLVATTTTPVRVMVTRPRLSILHMNQRWASRNSESAAIDWFRYELNLEACLDTSREELPGLEDVLLAEASDDHDAGHGGGDVVDHRRLHQVVNLLALQHPRVHGKVQKNEQHGNHHKPN